MDMHTPTSKPSSLLTFHLPFITRKKGPKQKNIKIVYGQINLSNTYYVLAFIIHVNIVE